MLLSRYLILVYWDLELFYDEYIGKLFLNLHEISEISLFLSRLTCFDFDTFFFSVFYVT